MKTNVKIVTSNLGKSKSSSVISQWINGIIEQDNRFNSELVNIAEYNLPAIDEGKGKVEETSENINANPNIEKWRSVIQDGDAFIFVVQEIKKSAPLPLINAIKIMKQDWHYKTAAFVSFGGISGGVQGALSLMPMLMGLKMHPIPEVLSIPLVQQYVRDGHLKSLFFEAQDDHIHLAQKILDEIQHWSDALKTIRKKKI